jgi:hypothetical protein
MFFVNQRLKVISDDVASPAASFSLSPEARLKVRHAFLEHTELIQAFVDENPAHLVGDELDIVRSWQHLVHGNFYVFREWKKYTVFLSSAEQPVAYGVLGLSQPFEDLIGPYLPVLVETVLLPFKGMIVYDGLMSSYNVTFGGGIRRSLNESFKQAKARHGIITSLPVPNEPLPAKAPRARPAPTPPSKEETGDALRTIIELVERFCREHLTEEYAAICRRLAEKLTRNRPSPLVTGSPSTWASGIVRTVGWVNFLHDKSQTPHMRLSDIDAGFGISESSGAAKLAAIRKMLRIHQLDPAWTLPSRMGDNPLAWMLEVDGFMVDVRHAPRAVQEIAFNKGLIPYIPADRPPGQQ